MAVLWDPERQEQEREELRFEPPRAGRRLLRLVADKRRLCDAFLCTATDDHKTLRALLVHHRYLIQATDSHGWTIIHMACTRKARKCIQVASEFGGDCRSRGRGGWTPAHSAACAGNALPDFVGDGDSYGWTPEQWVRRTSMRSARRPQIAGGADNCRSTRPENGITAARVLTNPLPAKKKTWVGQGLP
mmetsp:Transcript_45341/g.98368  ORF Transcript_45341/g.98368 Transcript_45341/m.98368 type:complete len:189 (+) Transcript_45341:40-606(+)